MDNVEFLKRESALNTGLFLNAALSVSGLAFWFIIGFPFAHHNESFLWEPELLEMSFLDTITSQITPVASYRPLGILTAWLSFTLSGDSIILQQLINFGGALIAWLILYFVSVDKRLFSWIALVAGAGFFSGYIYLFHLHGVFYSPLLIMMACLIYFTNRKLTIQRIIFSFVIAGIALLFHTFALLLYLGFLIGSAIDYRNSEKRIFNFLLILIPILLTGIYLVMQNGGDSPLSLKAIVSGLMVSYNMVELAPVLSILAFILALIAIVNTKLKRKHKILALIVSLIIFPMLFFYKIPVILLWVFYCLLKAIHYKKWSLAGIIASSAILPIATGTGSPTYAVFTIFACAFMTAYRSHPLKLWVSVQKRYVDLALLVLIFTTVILLKNRINIPVVTKLATPLLAEKEKTHQLASILEWISQSERTNNRVSFTQTAGSPSEVKNAVNRRNRPPAIASEVEYYLRHNTKIREADTTLLISFGSPASEEYEIIYEVPGIYNGSAFVYQIP